MVITYFLFGLLFFVGLCLMTFFLFKMVTLSLHEQHESFILKFGKLYKNLNKSGLYFVPEKSLPWVEVITISKQVDFRNFKGIQINDRFGTSMVIDLWLEFRIEHPYRALFEVENWETALEGVVVHSVGSILGSQTLDEVLVHKNELAERLQKSISVETERWGIVLMGAMIQNIGVLPEVAKQFFQTVAANIEKTRALVQEEGRLKVALLDAITARRIAELNGQAQSQLPLQMGEFYKILSGDPQWLKKYQEYWELLNVNPQKTVAFTGFSENWVGAVEVAKAMESTLSH